MPQWWTEFMLWIDTTYVSVSVVLTVAIAYFSWAFWRDLREVRREK